MSTTVISDALAHVAEVLDSPCYSDKEVFIMIPNIQLVDDAAFQKYLRDFQRLSDFSLVNEPGTQKFCAFSHHSNEGVDQIWALEHFDSESALSQHRTSNSFHEMISWLQQAKPNGSHPLPVPVVLQVMRSSFVRPAVKDAQHLYVVVTQIGFQADDFSDLEAQISEFGAKALDQEDILMFAPGRTESEVWVVVAYHTKHSFDKEGALKKSFKESGRRNFLNQWEEHVLQLKTGYLLRY